MNLLILFGVIALVEIPKHFIKFNNTKLVNFLTYLLMGIIAFIVGKYALTNYSTFTNILAISFIIVAFISILPNKKNDNN